MTVQSIACGACAAEVPYGRLSCPSCGELLASVAGSRPASVARRRPVAAAGGARTAVTDVLYDAGSGPTAAVVEGQLALPTATSESAALDLDEGLPWETTPDGTSDPSDLDGNEPSEPGDERGSADPTDGSSPNGGPAWVGLGLTGSPTPAYMPRPGLGASPAAASAFAGPGAYVPPVSVAVVPAGPPAPARAWASSRPDLAETADAGDGAAAVVGAQGTVPAASVEHADGRAEFVRWLSVAGAAFSAVGFLLPWGLVVIGSNDVGYFGRWGLAGPWHLGVAVGVLAVLALALVDNPIPAWIRTGLAGLGLGALILGLVWPYVLWPAMGTGPGALIAAIGATTLTTSGLLALVADRRAAGPRPV